MSKTCGDFGGINGGGKPCGAAAGKGTDHLGYGRCEDHPDEAPFHRIQHPKKRAFLAAFAATGNGSRAADAAGIDRTTPYSDPWKNDAQFQQAWDRARAIAGDVLEDEAVRRATEGLRKPYVHGGRVARDENGDPIYLREYSDTLLIFLLKGIKPEKYVDRHEVTGKGGGPIRTEASIDLKDLRDDELSLLEQLRRRAAVSN